MRGLIKYTSDYVVVHKIFNGNYGIILEELYMSDECTAPIGTYQNQRILETRKGTCRM